MNEQSIPSKINYKFLSDLPLKEKDDIYFGHNEIVDSLIDIIKNVEGPFTIGLFGSWGSGKSTIINRAKTKINKEIPFFVFDVWKHEADAFRRSFLIDLYEFLNQGNIFSDPPPPMPERLTKNYYESEKKQTFFGIEYNLFGKIIVGIFFLYAILAFFIPPLFEYITIPFFGVIITFFLPFLDTFSEKKEFRYFQNKYTDPYEFERFFKDILKNIKTQKLVIVFDNLDRVSENKTLEVLSTIKTFLEPIDDEIQEKSIISIIPCDGPAIEKHVKKTFFNYSGTRNDAKPNEDAKEFLNKFFNCCIEIPEFYPPELEEYTLNLLKETEIKIFQENNQISSQVAWIIIKGFRKNPRKIKQFINDLIVEYILISHRSGDGKDFEEGFFNENVGKITKYLIIKKKYPKHVKKINNEFEGNIDKYRQKEPEKNLNQELEDSDETELQDFLLITNDISISNIGIFDKLRMSNSEFKIPGIQKYFDLLEYRKVNEAREFVNSLISSNYDINSFKDLVKYDLEKRQLNESISNFLDTLLKSLHNTKIQLDGTLNNEICRKIIAKPDIAYLISPKLVFEDIIKTNSQNNKSSKDVIQIWTDYIHQISIHKYREYVFETLELIFNKDIILSDIQIQKFNKYFSTISNDLKLFEYISKKPEERQIKFIYTDSIAHFIENPNSSILDKIPIINNLSPNLVSFNNLNKQIDNINNIISKIQNPPNQENILFINNLTELIQKHKSSFIKIYNLNNNGDTSFKKFKLDLSNLQSRKNKTEFLHLIYAHFILLKEVKAKETNNWLELIAEIIRIEPRNDLLKKLNPEFLAHLYGTHSNFLILRTTSTYDFIFFNHLIENLELNDVYDLIENISRKKINFSVQYLINLIDSGSDKISLEYLAQKNILALQIQSTKQASNWNLTMQYFNSVIIPYLALKDETSKLITEEFIETIIYLFNRERKNPSKIKDLENLLNISEFLSDDQLKQILVNLYKQQESLNGTEKIFLLELLSKPRFFKLLDDDIKSKIAKNFLIIISQTNSLEDTNKITKILGNLSSEISLKHSSFEEEYGQVFKRIQQLKRKGNMKLACEIAKQIYSLKKGPSTDYWNEIKLLMEECS